MRLTQLCLSLCDLMDCSPRVSSVRGIFQTRILEWVAILFSRGSSWPRDQTQVSCIADRFFTIRVTREAPGILSLSRPGWETCESLPFSEAPCPSVKGVSGSCFLGCFY